MNNVKHTPGPWHAERGDNTEWCIVDAEYSVIAELSGNAQKANARLIAAAPDLLASLQNVVGTLVAQFPRSAGESMEVVRIARAIIAKVKS